MPHATQHEAHAFHLTYLDRFKIRDKSVGLTEPSGLALSRDRQALWTISDDTPRIFQLSLDGTLKPDQSFDIQDTGLEGIALDPSGDTLLAVKEETNEILTIDIKTHDVERHPLAGMKRYDEAAHYFAGRNDNKGLEGITCNGRTGTVFVMKERSPGLLVEVSPDLQTIQSHRVLDSDNGFRDLKARAGKIDFSDLCYDPSRDAFWIISDEASRLFLYDWQNDGVIGSAKLRYKRKGKDRHIEKAEGVAVDPDTKRLYIVSDEEARLYVFQIHQ